jgi:hypothetical protein
MFWLTFAFYAFVGWFFLKFDPFSISSKTASISEDVLMRLIAPLYPADHQNDIAIVLIDARTLRYLDDDWPILYRHHQRILEEILYYEPKAVMVNVWFRRSRVRLTDIGASFFESPMFPLTTDIEAERAAARLKDVLDVARDDLRPVVARLADRLRSVPTKLFFARGRAGDAYAGELDEMPATPVVTVWHAEPRRYPLILDGGRALNEQAGLAVTDPSSSARLADADGSPPAYTAAFQIYRFLCLSGGVRCRDKEVDDGDFTQPLALVWGAYPAAVQSGLGPCEPPGEEEGHAVASESPRVVAFWQKLLDAFSLAITGYISPSHYDRATRLPCPYTPTIVARDLLWAAELRAGEREECERRHATTCIGDFPPF